VPPFSTEIGDPAHSPLTEPVQVSAEHTREYIQQLAVVLIADFQVPEEMSPTFVMDDDPAQVERSFHPSDDAAYQAEVVGNEGMAPLTYNPFLNTTLPNVAVPPA
jgi:hypothetical protein